MLPLVIPGLAARTVLVAITVSLHLNSSHIHQQTNVLDILQFWGYKPDSRVDSWGDGVSGLVGIEFHFILDHLQNLARLLCDILLLVVPHSPSILNTLLPKL